MDMDLMECKSAIEKQILVLEGKTFSEVSAIKLEIHHMRESLDELVTMTRFRPVELVVYGGVAGVLMAALGMVMGKILGWTG